MNYVRWAAAMVLGVALIPSGAWTMSAATPIEGRWECAPLTVVGKDFTTTTIDRHGFLPGGNYEGSSALVTQLASGKSVRTEHQIRGRWTIKGDLLILKSLKGTFTRSDDPNYDMETGQRDLDALFAKKNWNKNRIIHLTDTLEMKPFESSYQSTPILIRCHHLVPGNKSTQAGMDKQGF